MISPKTIEFYAYRSTGTERHSIFRGGPVKFRAILDNSIDLTGCTSLRLDIRGSVTDTDSPLATEEITSISGTVFDFEFSTAQTNHDITSAWLVLSAYFPEGSGDTDDNLDPLYIAELTVVPHNASLLAPSPPDASVAITQTFADSRYLVNSGSGQSLLGRYSSGTGVYQAITLGSNLSMDSSGVLSAGAGGYSTIQSSGASVTQRSIINFSGFNVSDNGVNSRTDISLISIDGGSA